MLRTCSQVEKPLELGSIYFGDLLQIVLLA